MHVFISSVEYKRIGLIRANILKFSTIINMYKNDFKKFVAPAVKQALSIIISRVFPPVKGEILLQNGPKGQCDYVSPSAMKEFNVHKNKKEGTTFGTKTVAEFAQKIAAGFQENPVIGSLTSNQKGFLQIKVKDAFVEERVNDLIKDLSYPEVKKQTVVVDFSSPNIAKQMHVGHLRSTIIGESICRMLEYMGHHVHRANHVGDWGTQFGMLIAYMRQAYPDYEQNFPDIRDLDTYYKKARARFDSDPAFKKLSQQTVVKLQAAGQSQLKAWKMICAVSRDYFNIIYKKLNVKIDEFGESFYNPFIPKMLEELEKLNMIKEDDTKTKKGVKEEKQKKGKKKDEKQEGKKQEKHEEKHEKHEEKHEKKHDEKHEKTHEEKLEKKEKQHEKKEEKQEKKHEEHQKKHDEKQKHEEKPKIEEKKPKQKKQSDEEEQFDVPGDGRKAKCIFIEKYAIPLIVVKSDGGYNYDTTDMAAIQYRLQTLKADRIILITDSGQREHFEMIIAAAKKAGWLTTQRAEHMGFGVILGEDGKKFKTRNGVTVKLLDLLDQAKQKALIQLKSREKVEKVQEKGDKEEHQQIEEAKQATFTALKPEQYEDAAQKLGYASIKYFDLKQNRISDYIFSFEKMLDPKGNTAVYLIYAYVRMCSIIRKSGMTSAQIVQLAKEKPFKITHPEERALAAMLIKFYDVIEEAVDDQTLNKVTDFIYDICVKVQENYKKYRILGDPNMESRIILVEAVRKVLEKSFYFVGIVPIEKI